MTSNMPSTPSSCSAFSLQMNKRDISAVDVDSIPVPRHHSIRKPVLSVPRRRRVQAVPIEAVRVVSATEPNLWVPLEIVMHNKVLSPPPRSVSGSVVFRTGSSTSLSSVSEGRKSQNDQDDDDEEDDFPVKFTKATVMLRGPSASDAILLSKEPSLAALMPPKSATLPRTRKEDAFHTRDLFSSDDEEEEQKQKDSVISTHSQPALTEVPPRCSIFARRIIAQMKSTSPFDRPNFGSLGPRELSFCLEDTYCPLTEILRAMTVRFTSRDVLVCSPLRTGQSPILRGLAMLARGNATTTVEDHYLAAHIGYLGSTLPHIPQAFVDENSASRLFKTNINLRCFIRVEKLSKNSPKIIIPLRDPSRVLESWFRHLSSVYEFVENKTFPFGQADFKSFCPGSFNPAHYQEGEAYEKFIACVLRVMHLPNVCVVFYEDLFQDDCGEQLFTTLADFTGFSKGDTQLIRTVARAVHKDFLAQEFKFEPVFADDFLLTREHKWRDHVQYHGTSSQVRAKNYYELYESLTGRTFPIQKFQSLNAVSKPRLSDLLFFASSARGKNTASLQ